MKKLFLLVLAACSVYAGYAQSCVTAKEVGVDYATKQVTFDLHWETCNPPNHNYRVWVFVDYRPIMSPTVKGAWQRATIIGAGAGTFITGTPNETRRITLPLDVPYYDKFDWCAFATDYPPNVMYTSATQLTLRGTPPFYVTYEGDSTPVRYDDRTVNPRRAQAITALTDATSCPGLYDCVPTQPNLSAATICSGTPHTFNLGDASVPYGSFTYQWQQSTDGTNFTNISGATGQNYTTPTFPVATEATTTMYYRRVVTPVCADDHSVPGSAAMLSVRETCWSSSCPQYNPCTCGGSCPSGQLCCGGTCRSTTCPSGQAYNPYDCVCQTALPAGCPLEYRVVGRMNHEQAKVYSCAYLGAGWRVSQGLELRCLYSAGKIQCNCYFQNPGFTNPGCNMPCDKCCMDLVCVR